MDPRHHHHHHRHDDEEVENRYDEQGPPPPPQSAFPPPIQHFPNQINPNFGYAAPPPAYPPVHHLSHEIDPGFNQYAPSYPPHHGQHLSHELSPDYAPNSYPPPPPPPHVHHLSHELSPDYAPNSYPPPVQHLSHEINQPPPPLPSDHHHHYQPHLPSFVHHHTHEAGSDLSNKPTVRVYCKAETAYSLTVRDGKVILSRSDPNDMFQHWIKDEKYSTRVKDEEGFPSFALVNKATGQAMKHSIGATHPVQLIPYNPDTLDESILWAESKDLGDGYRTIRMVNNIRLNLDAFNGDKNHGGVHEGTIAVLWEWKKGDNQRWKIAPY